MYEVRAQMDHLMTTRATPERKTTCTCPRKAKTLEENNTLCRDYITRKCVLCRGHAELQLAETDTEL